MNCNVPTDIVFSFTGFATRGGLTDEHKDGWGIAFFEGAGVRLFVDHQSAIASPVAALIKSYPIKSKHVKRNIYNFVFYNLVLLITSVRVNEGTKNRAYSYLCVPSV
jgi:hypothetical protein